MNWVTPGAGLLFAAIALPLLLALYILRLQRQELRIPATFLWFKSVEDLHANTPFQRLRPSILLILQMVALILVVIAIMQPQFQGVAPRGGNHVLLIDCSASMSATDEGVQSRLEVAKEKAIELVTQLHGSSLFAGDGGKTMVIAFSNQAKIIIPFTDSKNQLVNAIKSIEQTHGQSSITESLQLARAYTTNLDPEQDGLLASDSAQLELFSDGQIDDLQFEALQRGEKIVFHSVGSSETTNIGIHAISVNRTSETGDEIQVFLSLLNSSVEPVITDITLLIDGVPSSILQVEIKPSYSDLNELGLTNIAFLPFALPNGGVLTVSLESTDSYEVDNSASLVVPSPRALSILLTESDAPLLKTVLEGMPLKQLVEMSCNQWNQLDVIEQDVIVTRGCQLDSMPPGRYLVFGSPPPLDAFSAYIEGKGQAMLVGKEDHPVLRFVRYEDVFVSRGIHIIEDDQLNTLLEGSQWPAILHYREGSTEIIYVAFDPLESNWPYLRSFPFFVYNTIQFLGRNGETLAFHPKQIGESVSFSIPHGIEVASITLPNHLKSDVSIVQEGLIHWGPIKRVGIHTLDWKEDKVKFVAHHPSRESKLASKSEILIGATKVTTSSAIQTQYISLWPWSIGMVLFVLLLEWWLYQKKIGNLEAKTPVFLRDTK